MTVTTSGNRILVYGILRHRSIKPVLASIYNLVHKAGCDSLELDLSACDQAYGSGILPIAAKLQRLFFDEKIPTNVRLPTDSHFANMFKNANWAHLLSPTQYEASDYSGVKQIPAAQFKDGMEQFRAVDVVMKKTLEAIEVDRDRFKALEWSLNEITDNVINHSNSSVGGMMQLTISRTSAKPKFEFVVCDAGVGIPRSLRSGAHALHNDVEALDRAIREGVTRDKAVGQGNGLFGSWRVTVAAKGMFDVYSGWAALHSSPKGIHFLKETVPMDGSLIVSSIDLSTPLSIEDALTFGGKPHSPLDYIDLNYSQTDEPQIVVSILDEATKGFGTRASGAPLRLLLKNLSENVPDRRIVLDFSDIPLISSSFADEAIGKLVFDLGVDRFKERFEFRHVDETVRTLIERAIQQRLGMR